MLTEQTKTLQEIENNYDVLQITYRNISLWAVLRINLADVLNEKTIGVRERGEASFAVLKTLLKSLFYFNPFKIFKKYDIWLFDAAEQRKLFENKAILRNSGAVPEHFEKTLVIESPFPKFHANKKQIFDKNVVSTALFYFLTFVFESYFRLISLKFNGEPVLKQINSAYHLCFDYKSTFYRFWAQYRAMSFLLKITKKPKVAVLICPSTKMGFVLAFKQKNIKVVEIQHGVINKNHPAYNSYYANSQYFPDEIYVFGDTEKQIFEQENKCFINPKFVYPVGNYFLEKIKNTPIPNLFAEQRKQYEVIVVVAGQEYVENQLFNFLNQAAKINNKLFFAYIPRIEKDYTQFIKATNIGIFNGSIHEFITSGDIHATICSTACLEANYLGKTNVFINLDNYARLYYEPVFQSTAGAYFAETPEEFVSLIVAHWQEKIVANPMFYADNHEEKIQKLIQRHLKA